MNLLGMADPAVISTDGLTELAFGIIRILAYGALGVAVAGIVIMLLCDVFECGKTERRRGLVEPRRAP
jgi:hypothetical protein